MDMHVVIAQPATDPEAVTAASAVGTIEQLTEIWGEVVERLSGLAAQTQAAAADTPFALDEIEFHVGIEAGLSVGLVTRGKASVSLTFVRRGARTRD